MRYIAAFCLFALFVAAFLIVSRTHAPVPTVAEIVGDSVPLTDRGMPAIPAMGMIDIKLHGGAVFLCALRENLDGSHLVDLYKDGTQTLLPAGRYVFLALWPSGAEVRGAVTLLPGKIQTFDINDPAAEEEKK